MEKLNNPKNDYHETTRKSLKHTLLSALLNPSSG
jgi:hypothetical protein